MYPKKPPSLRYKCIGSDYVSRWEASEWMYDLPLPFVGVLWLDLSFIESEKQGFLLEPDIVDHSSWITELLDKIGLDFEKGDENIRIFGYAPKDYDGFQTKYATRGWTTPLRVCHPERLLKMMGPKTKELVSVLQSLIDLLQRNNETHWSKWIRVSKSRIEASDFSGVTHLLGAYGGMGSFNDLTLGQSIQRGKIVWKDNQAELNEELSRLRSEAWVLATHIKRSQD